MKIHKFGVLYILITALIIIFVFFLLKKINTHKYLIYFIETICFLTIIIITQLFRNPSRRIIRNENVILSPLDGKITTIEDIENYTLIINCSIFDIHIIRSPVDGKINVLKNEQSGHINIIIEDNKQRKYTIKGLKNNYFNKIKLVVENNEKVSQGEEIGFLKFHNQFLFQIPFESKIKTKKNERVTAGQSVLADIK